MVLTGPSTTSGSISREHAASLHSLLVLSILMTETAREEQILHFATTSVPSLAPSCELAGVYYPDTQSWRVGSPRLEVDHRVAAALARQVEAFPPGGGALALSGSGWGFAYPLRSINDCLGFLVILADREPSRDVQFLLRVLAQQTGVALSNARMILRDRERAVELAQANAAMEGVIDDLRHTMEIHARLNKVATSGGGRDALAQTLHELTGFTVAIEDRYGNLRAWAPGEPADPYPKPASSIRERLLRDLSSDGHPKRHGERVVALASPRSDVAGTVALVDPEGKAGAFELVALEYGATVLAVELARLASMAEAELRVSRDLVEELLAGVSEDQNEEVILRGQALCLDLERPHRVVIVHGQGRSSGDDQFLHLVKRVAWDLGAGSLLVARGEGIVILADADLNWETFRQAVLAELGGSGCRIAVGGPYLRPSEVPRSHREANLACTLQASGAGPDVFSSESLGAYGILSSVDDMARVEQFVHAQLDPLLDYDALRSSNLVETLFHYLESGGNYADTSDALIVHRSTLKYRLQRIREISGHDLSDPGTRFNLQLATRAWRILKALGRLD